MYVNDNTPNGLNGNAGDLLNFASGGPANCCGFYQPSFSLVNSFKTDPATGLPLLETWNEFDVKNDQGIASTSPFTPYSGTLDPRLDYTVGRRADLLPGLGNHARGNLDCFTIKDGPIHPH